MIQRDALGFVALPRKELRRGQGFIVVPARAQKRAATYLCKTIFLKQNRAFRGFEK